MLFQQKIYDINGDIQPIRYIRLTKKIKIDETFTVYLESVFSMNNIHIDSSGLLCYNNLKKISNLSKSYYHTVI